MKIETRVRPNTLTKVAKTPGSYPIVKFEPTIKNMTITSAPPHRTPTKTAFIINDSLNLLPTVNYPES